MEDKREVDIIRLLDCTGIMILDSVSTQYEDSFSLESFGDLVDMARESKPDT